MKRDLVWIGRTVALLAAGAGWLGACDAIVGAGERELNDTVVCNDQGCSCAVGRGDCDGDADNGCETDLASPDHCGACGVVCENGGCDAATFTCSCDPGQADCDGDPTTICETSLATDGEHCGTCGRSCAGAACEDGLCEPEPITAVGPIYSFTVADGVVYYATFGDMGMFRLVDGAAEPFGDPMQFVNLMQHHAGTIYWTTDTTVQATSIATGETVTLAMDENPGGRLSVGGDKVYWGNLDDMTMIAYLHRAPVTPGGAVEEIVALGDVKFVFDFAASEEHVYWNDIGQVMRSPHDMVAPELWKNVQTPPTFLEPASDGLLYSGSPGGTFFVPFGAGAVTKLADVEGYGVLAADEEHVYFISYVFGSDAVPALYRAPLSGEGPTIKLAEDPFMSPGIPLGLDDVYVYWIGGSTGEIVRVAK